MTVLITGAAGFIGFSVAKALLQRGDEVVGLDNFNAYYDVGLKRARAAILADCPGFRMVEGDITDRTVLERLAKDCPQIDRIVHLAAQAGVRYSIDHPRAYVQSNVVGFLEILEFARALPGLAHLVYASSSSVYGGSTTVPFALDDACEAPLSLYAATKRSNELMAFTYSHLYGIKATGLRFFTVYGPWGRPDMAPMIFARAIFAGMPIRLFNHGQMERDFTYVDDIVAGTVAALDHPPAGAPPHRLFNLGNRCPEPLLDFVRVLEEACGRKALTVLEDMQPGDVRATYADIDATERELGYRPSTSIHEGVPRFVEWYRTYYRV